MLSCSCVHVRAHSDTHDTRVCRNFCGSSSTAGRTQRPIERRSTLRAVLGEPGKGCGQVAVRGWMTDGRTDWLTDASRLQHSEVGAGQHTHRDLLRTTGSTCSGFPTTNSVHKIAHRWVWQAHCCTATCARECFPEWHVALWRHPGIRG